MIMHISSWEALLFAVVEGEINSGGYERMLKLASSISARKGISKILIDGSRVTGTLSPADRVELGQRLADHIKKTGANPHVAFVGHPPTFNGLGVATSRTRGVNAMLFGSVPDALKWLRRPQINEKDLVHHAVSPRPSGRTAHPH
jgi:hypothetical protein